MNVFIALTRNQHGDKEAEVAETFEAAKDIVKKQLLDQEELSASDIEEALSSIKESKAGIEKRVGDNHWLEIFPAPFTPNKISFTINDNYYSDEPESLEVSVEYSKETDVILVTAEGYGDNSSQEGGVPMIIDFYDEELNVRIWSDINNEEATHTIRLEGARESMRRETIYRNKLGKYLSLFIREPIITDKDIEFGIGNEITPWKMVEEIYKSLTLNLNELKGLTDKCGESSNEIQKLTRPYFPITKEQHQALLSAPYDYYMTETGHVVTFGEADGGYALMPLQEQYAQEIIHK
ncbi:MAG: hypothetical protein U9N57_01055 [Pseudomonadota bacterium]|nr:hypothetical protein [Pseudomonadota bacterium]